MGNVELGRLWYGPRTERLCRDDVAQALYGDHSNAWMVPFTSEDCFLRGVAEGEQATTYHTDRNGIEFTINTVKTPDETVTYICLPKRYRWEEYEANPYRGGPF